jgi:hypothetical protein
MTVAQIVPNLMGFSSRKARFVPPVVAFCPARRIASRDVLLRNFQLAAIFRHYIA